MMAEPRDSHVLGCVGKRDVTAWSLTGVHGRIWGSGVVMLLAQALFSDSREWCEGRGPDLTNVCPASG